MKRFVIPAMMLAGLFTACESDDFNYGTPGASLVDVNTAMVVDSSFTAQLATLTNDSVLSRTTTQLLGAIEDKEYGTLRAGFYAQMFPASHLEADLEPDSIKLQLVFKKDGFVGDSVAPIGFDVYELGEALKSPVYSNCDPKRGEKLGSGVFSAVGSSISSDLAANPYRFAYAKLPKAFQDRVISWIRNPQYSGNPLKFQNEFKGFYVKHSFGSGRVTRIDECRVILYSHKNHSGDSISKHFSYVMAMAPELVSGSHIDLRLKEEVKQGKAVVATPAGTDVEMQLPIKQLVERVKHASTDSLVVVNKLSLRIPAASIASTNGLLPPGNLLLVKKEDKAAFFENNQLPNDSTSFLGVLDSSTMTYVFSDMRNYLIKAVAKGTPAEEFEKFVLTPVIPVLDSGNTDYFAGTVSNSTTISGLTPMVSRPAMVELKTPKITLTYSRQSR